MVGRVKNNKKDSTTGEESDLDKIHRIDLHCFRDAKVIVITDDENLKKYIRHLAGRWSLHVEIYPNLNETQSMINSFTDYNALIVDFDIENSNGIEVAEYINLFEHRIPTILISGSVYFDVTNGDLPPYIDLFVPKCLGTVHILNNALSMIQGYERRPSRVVVS